MHDGDCIPLYGVLSGLHLNIKLKIIPNQTIYSSVQNEFTNRLKFLVGSTLNWTVSLQTRDIYLWFLPRSKMNSKGYYIFYIYFLNQSGKIKYSQAIEEIHNFYMLIKTQNTLILSTGIKIGLNMSFGNEFVKREKSLIDRSTGKVLQPLIEKERKIVWHDPVMTVSESNWCYMTAFKDDEIYYDTLVSVLKLKQTNIPIYEDLFDPFGNTYLCIDMFIDVQGSNIVSDATYTIQGETDQDETPWYFSTPFIMTWFIFAAVIIGLILHKLKSLSAERAIKNRTTEVNIAGNNSSDTKL